MKSPNARRFVPKRYGRGFTPVSRQGRVCTIILVVIIMLSSYEHNLLGGIGPTAKDYAGFCVDMFIIIFSTSWYMDRYTDGELGRRRGKIEKR